MENILIAPLIKSKKYITGLHHFQFPSLLSLLFEIFNTYTNGRKELSEIELLLDEIGYRNIKDIPPADIQQTKAFIIQKLPEWDIYNDTEYVSYKLIAAIVNQRILVYINNAVIKDIDAPIHLDEQSTIAFIDTDKISAITFSKL